MSRLQRLVLFTREVVAERASDPLLWQGEKLDGELLFVVSRNAKKKVKCMPGILVLCMR